MRLLIYLIVFLMRPFTGVIHGIQDSFRRMGKAGWVKVNGHIELIAVRPTRNHTWIVTLSYSYSAGGEYWTGEISREFYAAKHADRYAEQHPTGTAVVVRHHPKKFSKSTVLKEDQLAVAMVASI
jgi:hypothetical protein